MAISSESAPQTRDSSNGMAVDTRGGSYIFGKVLYRCVVKAQRTDASLHIHVPRLVEKFSLRSAARTPEEKFNARASGFAIDAGGASHLGAQYLPLLIHSEDLQIMPGSTQAPNAEMLHNASSSSCKTREEDIVGALRIVVMEELLPIDTLTSASEFAQVFFDVLNCHKWLHDVARILHRDIDMSNIMYRYGDDGAVYGVLNDMDLSSPVADLEQQKATSCVRTGTPPFMAGDLLNAYTKDVVHRYRHDLESLFYVMLILSTRHRISPNALPRANNLVRQTSPPFNKWFEPTLTWWDLGSAKKTLILEGFLGLNPPLSVYDIFPPDSTFVGFRSWIVRLRMALNRGFSARLAYNNELEESQADGGEFAGTEVDEENLGGKIQYSTFFNVMKSFVGKDLRAPPETL